MLIRIKLALLGALVAVGVALPVGIISRDPSPPTPQAHPETQIVDFIPNSP